MSEENQFQKMDIEIIYDPRGNNNDIIIRIFGKKLTIKTNAK